MHMYLFLVNIGFWKESLMWLQYYDLLYLTVMSHKLHWFILHLDTHMEILPHGFMCSIAVQNCAKIILSDPFDMRSKRDVYDLKKSYWGRLFKRAAYVWHKH